MDKSITQIQVGIDVAKDGLDIHMNPVGKAFRIKNSADGINKLIKMLKGYDVKQVAFEASGGYEDLVDKMLSSKGYETWRVDPVRVKAFIASKGIRAKTDKIDAEMIALFASENTRSYEKIVSTDDDERLQSLNKRRAALSSMITEENNRLKSPSEAYSKDDIKEHIEYMQNKIKDLDRKIAKFIGQNERWSKVNAIVNSVPGIGAVTAATLIADMKELGKVSDKEISALAGLAPFIQQSGASKGFASIKGGRHRVRNPLYMAAVVATRYNPKLKEFYEKLRKRGKIFKVAIVAVMRKLLVILNAMVQSGECWRVEARS